MKLKFQLAVSLIMVLSLSIVFTLFPTTSYACSCAELPSVEEQFNRSEAVFSGKVIEVENKNNSGYITKSVLFEVINTWKGMTQSQVFIATGGGGGDCGIDFHVNQKYLVYAQPSTMYSKQDLLTTIMCDRTQKLDSAQEDLTILGEGQPPTEEVHLIEDRERKEMIYWVVSIALVSMTIGMMIFLLRGKKNKG